MKTIAGNLSHQQPMFDIGEPSPPFISCPHQHQLNNQAEDSEISIFDAEKYFNESGSNDPRTSKRVSPVNVNVINLQRISERCDFSSLPSFCSASSSNYRTRSFHATPTASSEASWNSQTGLLSNPPGAIAISMRDPAPGPGPVGEKKKGSAAKTKWLLGRKCPCSGKKSVQVEEKLSEPTTTSRLNRKSKDVHVEKSSCTAATDHWLQRQHVMPNSHRISAESNRFPSGIGHHGVLASSSAIPFITDCTNGFSFPILNQTSSSSSSPIKLVLDPPPPPPLVEDPPRDSLEVFRPSDDPISSKTGMELQRQSFTFPASPKSRMTMTDDDMASDASSDLFEIESFSTQTTSHPMYNHRRDLLEEARRNGYCRQSLDDVAPTEFYEPSEASIDWSVTTAEGFDRASSVAISEVEEMTIIMRHHESDKSSSSGGKRRGGTNNGGLLSCRCEKAVSVGPHPVKCASIEGQRGGNFTFKHVSSRPPIPNKPPLARSHSARLSLPFAT